MSEFYNLIDKIRQNKKKFLVIGDAILDKYLLGSTDRVSPESSTLVVRYLNEVERLGGAANVAYNIKELKQEVWLATVIGDDNEGDEIKKLSLKYGINTELFITDKRRCTTVKTRILGEHNQQLIRIDREENDFIKIEIVKLLIEKIKDKIDFFDCIIVSDYMKGVITDEFMEEIISLSKKRNIPILIDVKDKNVLKYKDAWLIKLNKHELKNIMEMNSEDDLFKEAIKLKEKVNAKVCIVTKGSDGMILIDEQNKYYEFNAIKREAYDVTGAGDTVLACLSVCKSISINLKVALEFSNIAASLKISKIGTSPVSLDEIDEYVSKGYRRKIKEWDSILDILRNRENKRIVFTNGCFDILHIGHIRYLEKAKELGDILIVGINSDLSVRKIKGKNKPIVTVDERMELLSAMDFIDYIIKFDEDNPYELIKLIKPDILVKGSDYSENSVIGADIVKSYGGKVELISYIEGKSSSNIINKILEIRR